IDRLKAVYSYMSEHPWEVDFRVWSYCIAGHTDKLAGDYDPSMDIEDIGREARKHLSIRGDDPRDNRTALDRLYAVRSIKMFGKVIELIEQGDDVSIQAIREA